MHQPARFCGEESIGNLPREASIMTFSGFVLPAEGRSPG